MYDSQATTRNPGGLLSRPMETLRSLKFTKFPIVRHLETVWTITGPDEDKEVADGLTTVGLSIDKATSYESRATKVVHVDPRSRPMESALRNTRLAKAHIAPNLGAQDTITALSMATGARVHHIPNV